MTNEQISVVVDRDLEDLIPGFMQRRREDVSAMRNALTAGDMEALRICGHSMKGTGGGYGFDEISTIGSAIEQAAIAGDKDKIAEMTDRLEAYLDKVVITFE